jgi:hypothetical protein
MSSTVAPISTPAKVSEWSKVKGFFAHMFSFFKNDAANFETSAATTISLAAPLLGELVTLTAGTKEAGVVSSVVAKVTTALNNTAALLKGAQAGSADHSVAGYLNDVVTDLPTLLEDVNVKNSEHLAEIEGTVTTVVGEVKAILAALPEDHPAPVVMGASK